MHDLIVLIELGKEWEGVGYARCAGIFENSYHKEY